MVFDSARSEGQVNGECLVGRRAGLPQQQTGFTLIELLITTFIIGTVLVGVFGLFVLGVRLARESENRLVGIALANEKMELVRNLPYVNVGTAGGIPAGTLLQEETVARNEVNFLVKTDIRYIDDPFDGLVGAGGGGGCVAVAHIPPGQGANCQDLCVGAPAINAHLAHGDSLGNCAGDYSGPDVLNTDYKQVRVEVSWSSPNQPRPIVLLTKLAPDGVEGGELFGTLDFMLIDSLGVAVPGANVQLLNDTTNPTVNLATSTDDGGHIVVPGLPEASQSYELSVSKTDYNSEQTYGITPTFIPDADHTHLTMLIGEVTQKTFIVDLVSSLAMSFEEGGDSVDNYCEGVPPRQIADMGYTFRGTKTIGVDGSGDPVYVVDEAGTSDVNGESSLTDLVWDSYQFGLAEGAVCDIKETSLLLPINVSAGETLDMTIRLVKHTDVSLHVTLANSEGLPIDNVTAHLTGNGVDETLGTGMWGQVLFSELPVNGDYLLEVSAPGYVDWSDTVTVEDTTLLRVDMSSV